MDVDEGLRRTIEWFRQASTGSRRAAPALGRDAMIDDELKAILVCPACKGDLLFEETRIICPACRQGVSHPGRHPGDAGQRGGRVEPARGLGARLNAAGRA